MPEIPKLHNPWLIAVWPGMGNVAIGAGYYLLAKLEMDLLAEFSARELFEVDHVEVSKGLIQTGRLPRSRIFVWRDPGGRHDLVLFLGEAQPPRGKYAFCRRLIKYAQSLGVEHVFTFAAMATPMSPDQEPRVFGAATDHQGLSELRRLELQILEDGQISGLNGVLVGAAADNGLQGSCLLGEMPHVFVQLPFPKASLAVLQAFATLSGVEIDMEELAGQVQAMERRLVELYEQIQQAMASQIEATDEPPAADSSEPAPEEILSAADRQHIDRLFERASLDRSKAYELKRELDRLSVFEQYEDRFLDLFRKSE